MNEAQDNDAQDGVSIDPQTQARAQALQEAAAARALASPLDRALYARGGRVPAAPERNYFDDDEPFTQPSMLTDPQALQLHDLYVVVKGVQVDCAVNALAALHDACKRTIDARRAVAMDPALTPAARVLKVADLQGQLAEAALPKADAAMQTLKRYIESAEDGLRAPVKADTGNALGREIAEHVRGLSVSERLAFVSKAVQAGDHLTVHAVLARPPYLVGLSDEAHAGFTEQWNKARDPVAVQRLELLRFALARVEEAATLVAHQGHKFIGAKALTIRTLNEQRQRAQRAWAAAAS